MWCPGRLCEPVLVTGGLQRGGERIVTKVGVASQRVVPGVEPGVGGWEEGLCAKQRVCPELRGVKG